MKQLLFMTFCVIGIAGRAQNIQLNVMTGPSITWMRANKNIIESSGNKISYKAHLVVEYWLTERYALTGGIGFSLFNGGALEYKKGGDLLKEVELSDSIYHHLAPQSRIDYKINFLDFPVGLKIRTGEYRGYRLFLHAPEIIFGIRTKARGKITSLGLPYTEDEDIRDAISFLNLFYGIQIGLEKNLSEDLSLLFGVRFIQSFSDITKDSGTYDDGTKENSKGILTGLDFRVGITF